LTYLEKKEFAAIEEAILAAEEELGHVQTALDEANTAADHNKLQELFVSLKEAQDRIDVFTRAGKSWNRKWRRRAAR